MTFALVKSIQFISGSLNNNSVFQVPTKDVLCGLIGGLCDLACTRAPIHWKAIMTQLWMDELVHNWVLKKSSSSIWLWSIMVRYGQEHNEKNVFLSTHHPSYMVPWWLQKLFSSVFFTLSIGKAFYIILIGTRNHQFRWILDFPFHHHLLVHSFHL
jgi:isoprenylcysteine carboxyl methyltransferase (ICMT) family protein YpbQ